MTADPIQFSSEFLDLSAREVVSTAVFASPSAAAETNIASLIIRTNAAIMNGIKLTGWCAVTVGTGGTGLQLRIRQTSLTGQLTADTGITVAAAGSGDERSAYGFDTAAVLPGQVYVLTLQVASASAASTVSAVYLAATVI